MIIEILYSYELDCSIKIRYLLVSKQYHSGTLGSRIEINISFEKMNTNIIHIPQDHKNFIYERLSIRDLVNLSESCKSFYQDEKRKETIQKKLIDSCFYSTIPLLKELHVHIFPNIINLYFEHFKRIKITHQSISHLKDTIPFFIGPFLSLSSNEKCLIITKLVDFLYDIWKYAQDKEFYYININLFTTFENILKMVFRNESNTIQIYILNELSNFSNKTKNGQRIYTKNRFTYNFNEPNRYTIDEFICHLNLFYWKDLPLIIRIADVLESYDEMYLYDFLYEIFQRFIDCNYLNSMKEDEYVELLEEQLYKKYDMSCDKTYKDRLFELFTSCEYMIHQEFDWAMELRTMRLNGMENEEDFDF